MRRYAILTQRQLEELAAAARLYDPPITPFNPYRLAVLRREILRRARLSLAAAAPAGDILLSLTMTQAELLAHALDTLGPDNGRDHREKAAYQETLETIRSALRQHYLKTGRANPEETDL